MSTDSEGGGLRESKRDINQSNIWWVQRAEGESFSSPLV